MWGSQADAASLLGRDRGKWEERWSHLPKAAPFHEPAWGYAALPPPASKLWHLLALSCAAVTSLFVSLSCSEWQRHTRCSDMKEELSNQKPTAQTTLKQQSLAMPDSSLPSCWAHLPCQCLRSILWGCRAHTKPVPSTLSLKPLPQALSQFSAVWEGIYVHSLTLPLCPAVWQVVLHYGFKQCQQASL